MNYGKKGVRSKQKALNSKSTKWGHKVALIILKMFLILLVAGAVIGVCGGIGVFRGIIASSPDISNIDVSPSGFSSFIYDSEGNQTAKLVASDSNRIPVTLDQIPENLAHAFVAIEDERFYTHNGIDIKGILRAAAEVVKSKGKLTQGASTITQQLLKNNVFTDWTSENSNFDKIKR